MQTSEFQHLPIAALAFSETRAQAERRKHFDKTSLTELAESIKAVGVAQPILVRRLTDGPSAKGFSFEIVAGERRVLGAKKAGLEQIPAVIRELTDDQVLELQLIENLQRTDVHPMAEAEGYETLKAHGRTPEEIAEKVGKSRTYVYGRLKLTALCAAARDAFYQGDLNPSTALLVARIPGDDQQERCLKHITEKDWHDRPMSYRDALRYVQDNFQLKLSGAPFPRDDETLVPSAGACGACPMRSGNQPELFGDVKSADVCTNPSCFQAKKTAFAKRELERASANGEKVIRGGKAKRILPDSRYHDWSGDGSHKQLRNGYARPRDKCLTDPKKRTYAELAGKDAPTVLLQNPENGRVEKVFELEAIKDELKAKGVTLPKKAESRQEQTEADREAEKARKDLERLERLAIFSACLKAAPSSLPHATLAGLVQEALARGGGREDEQALYDLLGWGSAPKGWEIEKPRLERLTAMRAADLQRLASVALFWEIATSTWEKVAPLEALAKELGVDVKAVRASVAPKVEKPAKDVPKKAKSPARKK